MIRRTAILAAALFAATPALAQEGSYVYLTGSGDSQVMANTAVSGPQTDRRVWLLLTFGTAKENGVDNYAFEFSANCTNWTYRYTATQAYAGETLLRGGPSDMPYSTPDKDTLNDDALTYACTGKAATDDHNVVNGLAAARRYAAGKRP